MGSRVLARICRCAACVLSHTNHKAETFHAGDGVIIIGTVGEGDGDGAGGKQQRRLPFAVASFGAQRCALEGVAVVLAAPPLAESELTNGAELSGAIALVHRGGGVSFAAKASRAQAAGALAVIIADEEVIAPAAGAAEEAAHCRLPLLGGADQEAASVTVPVVGVTHASGIALLGVAAARGECGGGSSGCTLCYDLNPHLLEVLNPYLSVASYTGGQETAETAVENVLVPKLRPYHCSGPGVGHTLSMTLGCENAVVTHFVVHAPVRPRVDRV